MKSSPRRRDVGLRKIVVLVEERFSRKRRKSIGKAVAVVQAGRMTSPAIALPGPPRTIGMFGCSWEDFDFCLVELEVEIGARRARRLPISSPANAIERL